MQTKGSESICGKKITVKEVNLLLDTDVVNQLNNAIWVKEMKWLLPSRTRMIYFLYDEQYTFSI